MFRLGRAATGETEDGVCMRFKRFFEAVARGQLDSINLPKLELFVDSIALEVTHLLERKAEKSTARSSPGTHLVSPQAADTQRHTHRVPAPPCTRRPPILL